jgi:hypothetical protein
MAHKELKFKLGSRLSPTFLVTSSERTLSTPRWMQPATTFGGLLVLLLA